MNKSLNVSLLSRHVGSKGGLEKWAQQIALGFAKKGAAVTILTEDAKPFDPSIQVTTLPLRRWSPSQKMKEFDQLCLEQQKKRGADIVFAMDRTSHQTHLRAGNGVHAAYLKQRKLYEGFSPLKQWLNPLHQTILSMEKKAFESPDLRVLFTNSDMVKNEILHHYNIPEEKITVIHNGAEHHAMEKDFSIWVERKQKILEELGLSPHDHHFLFAGNGYERKGLSLLLRALPHVKHHDFHLSIVGKDREICSFMALAQKLGLEKRVGFFGPQESIRPFYQMADTLVIPSIYDPFANVTVEALSMGLFVVSSKSNGGHEVLTEESGALIEDLKSPESLAVALSRALLHPKTWVRSKEIRRSISHLDFSNQLNTLIETTLSTL